MIRIKSIEVFKIDLPLKEGNYSWSHGNSVNSFDSTIVKINTNIGISGLGEVCTLGPAYLPAYAEGVRTGIKQIGKYLISKDPTDLSRHHPICDIATVWSDTSDPVSRDRALASQSVAQLNI